MENKDFRTLIKTAVVAVIFVFVLGLVYIYPNQVRQTLSDIQNAAGQLASVFIGHNFRSVAEIKSKYNSDSKDTSKSKVRILVVPGHEPNFGGSEYNNLKERDMNVELGIYLQKFLEEDPHYEVFLARDKQSFSSDFTTYYKNNWDEIVEWTKASRDEFSRLVSIGKTTKALPTVFHNEAPKDVGNRLYGITKWSNENNVDIVIHIHFNDNRRKNTKKPGDYSGFAIYVPASQYGSSVTTKAIAENVLKRMTRYNPVSDLPQESIGIIDEPELIAVGSNNTADAASMLIEYGYIYEPQFQDPYMRNLAIKDFALQTYLGLKDFFEPNGNIKKTKSYDTVILPHKWNDTLKNDNAPVSDVFALQSAFMFDGVYPPPGKSKNDCPRTGVIGPCTRASIEIFQNKYDITGEKGEVGLNTLKKLNQL